MTYIRYSDDIHSEIGSISNRDNSSFVLDKSLKKLFFNSILTKNNSRDKLSFKFSFYDEIKNVLQYFESKKKEIIQYCSENHLKEEYNHDKHFDQSKKEHKKNFFLHSKNENNLLFNLENDTEIELDTQDNLLNKNFILNLKYENENIFKNCETHQKDLNIIPLKGGGSSDNKKFNNYNSLKFDKTKSEVDENLVVEQKSSDLLKNLLNCPYEGCSKMFHARASVYQHISKFHLKKTYKCPNCLQQYTHSSSKIFLSLIKFLALKYHIKKFHDKEYRIICQSKIKLNF